MKNKILSLSVFVLAFLFSLQGALAQTAELPTLLDNPSDVWSWGFNNLGQTGVDDQASNIINPTLVTTEAIYVSGGESHGFYIDGDSTLWGFGKNANGQLGNGDQGGTAQYSPVEIAQDVVYVKAIRETSFYITSDGTLWAMGQNDLGQLGVDTGGESQFSPVEVVAAELSDVVAVDGGDRHTLFLTSDGTLYGIGNNNAGQLGVDPEVESTVTALVVIDNNVIQVASSFITTVYIKDDGSLWSLGDNSHGQLGAGDEALASSFTPLNIASNAASVNGAARQFVYIDDSDVLWGFGRGNWGQLGTGDATHAYSPVPFGSGDNVVSAATGQRHSIFAKNDGSVWVTGHNDQNQMAVENTEIGQLDAPEQRNIGEGNVTVVSTKGAFNLVIDYSPPATSINEDKELPNQIELGQNYPNPFNPTTNISYSLPSSEFVSLEVFNMAGQKVATLVNTRQRAGSHTVSFNAENISSGIYFYRLTAGSVEITKKLTLIK